MRGNSENFSTKLEAIVGKENVIVEKSRIGSLLNTDIHINDQIAAVCPTSEEEIQEIVRKAGEDNIAIFTFYNNDIDIKMLEKSGIIIDFTKMNSIERIDGKNLIAHIQRGVTYEDLQMELRERKLKILTPAAAKSPFVACNQVNRCINLAASRYPEVQVSNLKVVMANGEIHKTGSHALSEEASDCKEDGGPNLSRWYLGSEDIFGLMSRASVYLYPEVECRRGLLYGFENLEQAILATKDISRHEIPIECLIMNSSEFSKRFDYDKGKLFPWMTIIGLGGRENLVSYQERRVENLLTDYQHEKFPENNDIIGKLESPWYVIETPNCGFYSKIPDAIQYIDVARECCEQNDIEFESVGISLISFCRGSCFYNQFNFYNGQLGKDFIERLSLQLLKKGGYFDLPEGSLAQRIYSSMPSYLRILSKIKKMMDPNNIFNPGRPTDF